MKARKNLRPLLVALFLLTFSAFFVACEKPENIVGSEILPDEDELNLDVANFDSVICYTIPGDSTITSSLSINLLGNYHDPNLGFHQADLYTQIRLSTNNVSFGNLDSIVVDSIVLALDYRGDYYGELKEMEFHVYELSDTLNFDSTYFSNQSIDYFPDDLIEPGFNFVRPDPGNSLGTIVGQDTLPAQMRLKLKNELGQKFLAQSDSISLSDNANFLNYFKGLKITSEPTGGAVLAIDLLNSRSNLSLYYTTTTSVDTVQRTFVFNINENCLRYHELIHDYSSSVVQYQFIDSTLGKQQLYLQAGGGLTTRIKMPDMSAFLDTQNVAINKVQIILSVPTPKSSFALPGQIFAYTFDEEGKTLFIPDFFESELHRDGFFYANQGEYRINITRYVQGLINGEFPSDEIKILPISNSTSLNRVILNGSETMTGPVKFKVTYTKFR